MKRTLKPLVALLACAVGVASVVGLPASPASRMASVASAAAPASATPTASASATATATAKATPTKAPALRRPTADPISQARAILVAPSTFRVGGNTFLQAAESVGDEFVWRVTGDRFVMIGEGRKQALTFTEPDAPNAAEPFAVELLAIVRDKASGFVTSIDSTVVIVKPAGVVPPVVDPPKPPPVVDPTKPDAPPPVVDPATTPTAAIYVYEKDETAVPSAVRSALNRINRERKILATEFEDDTIDDTGSTPAQYAIPLAAARKAGLPALVVMAGSEVLSVTLAPTTEEQVLEAVK